MQSQFYQEQPPITHNNNHVSQYQHQLTYKQYHQNPLKDRLAACLLWLIGCSCWVVGYLYPNNHNVRPQVTNIWRSSLQIIINYILLRLKKGSVDIMPEDQNQLYLCILRGLIVATNLFIFTASQFYLPLPVVHTINSTMPIFVAAIDYFWNNNKINKVQILAMLTAFTGVIIIINFSQQLDQGQTTFSNYKALTKIQVAILQVILLANSCMIAFAMVLVKKMDKISPSKISLYNGLTVMIYTGILYPLNFHQLFKEILGMSVSANVSTYSNEKFLDMVIYLKGFLVSGAIFAGGQLIEIWALKICSDSAKIIVMENFTVVLAYLISVFSYGEPVTAWSLGGAILIVGGVTFTIK